MEVEKVLAVSFVSIGAGLFGYAIQDQYFGMLGAVELDLARRLRRLRLLTPRLKTWLVVWSIATLGSFLILWLILDSPVFGFVAACGLGLLPWHLIKRADEQRHAKIEDQLADSMVTLSSAIKAGLALAQALDILAEQTPRPIRDEFQQIIGEYQLGKPLEQTLDDAKQRLESENFALFAAALQASRKSGGKLNETVDRIAKSVLEMQRLERKISAETAQARKSAVYMALTPFFLLVVYYFVDQENTERLFTTFWGQILLSVSLVLNTVAYLWARVILNPDI